MQWSSKLAVWTMLWALLLGISFTLDPGLAITVFSDDYTPLFRNDGKWTFEGIGYQSGVGLPSPPWIKWGDAFVDLTTTAGLI